MKIVEDEIIKYILENFSSETPSYAKDVARKAKFPLARVCFILKELVDEDILARRRTGFSWEYFLIHPIDIEEYILDKQAGRIQAKQQGALGTNYNKLRERYNQLNKLARQHRITVQCSCGKGISIDVAAKVVTDDTS